MAEKKMTEKQKKRNSIFTRGQEFVRGNNPATFVPRTTSRCLPFKGVLNVFLREMARTLF